MMTSAKQFYSSGAKLFILYNHKVAASTIEKGATLGACTRSKTVITSNLVNREEDLLLSPHLRKTKCSRQIRDIS